MADPLSLASSLVALAGFAFQTSKSLYQVIDSFKSSKRAIRELREELEALDHALEALQQVAADNETALAALKLPLLRCAKICREFEDVINQFFARSDQQHTSFRDWAKLSYMGSDITHLKTTIAGYKATIGIALGGATFQRATVTMKVVNEYKKIISDAKSDLHDHLQEIEDRLKALQIPSQSAPGLDPVVQRDIREEKESIEQCLEICSQVSDYIKGIELRPQRSYPELETPAVCDTMQRKTSAILADFKGRLAANSADLETRLHELNKRIGLLSQQNSDGLSEHTEQLKNTKEERDSLVQCLAICTDASNLAESARTNEFEDIVSADDSQQVIVSTIGDLISARHIVTGSGSLQCFGQMSDDTVQQFSRGSGGNTREQPELRSQIDPDIFQGRYGFGYQLREPAVERK